MEKQFQQIIEQILESRFGKNAKNIFKNSLLLQYIEIKTRSVNKGSKARGRFANLYALYVIIEDYIENDFDKKLGYYKYEGAEFTKLFTKQRELPFGAKLQNHAFNNRFNSEFQKFFVNSELIPILRKLETNRYWINENLINIKIGRNNFNIANVIIEIINVYAKTKRNAFEQFMQSCISLQNISEKKPNEIEHFILGLLVPNVDARLFEIISFVILKFHYHEQKIYWWFNLEKLNQDNLTLYKTGRTNANDGGIDFVMKPLGRFFQVSETLDVKKYFLDIDKIQRYPITFVIKSNKPTKNFITTIRQNADRLYVVKSIDKLTHLFIPTAKHKFSNINYR